MDGIRGALHVMGLFDEYKKAHDLRDALLKLVIDLSFLKSHFWNNDNR